MNIKKPEAIKLRSAGYTYSMITAELGIARSTLSTWFKDVPFTPNENAKERIRSGRLKYGLRRKQERDTERADLSEVGRSDIGRLNTRDLWMIGLGLWLGEGSKTTEQIRFSNANPDVIKIWMRWLREVCNLSDSNIVARMHLYPDSNEASCRDYWQGITGLSENQFKKTQFDRRLSKLTLKNGKLPYGTLHLSVIALGDVENGVRLYRKLQGWISGILTN